MKVVLIVAAFEVEMSIISQDDFSMGFRIILMHFKNPIGKDVKLLTIVRLEFFVSNELYKA